MLRGSVDLHGPWSPEINRVGGRCTVYLREKSRIGKSRFVRCVIAAVNVGAGIVPDSTSTRLLYALISALRETLNK